MNTALLVLELNGLDSDSSYVVDCACEGIKVKDVIEWLNRLGMERINRYKYVKSDGAGRIIVATICDVSTEFIFLYPTKDISEFEKIVGSYKTKKTNTKTTFKNMLVRDFVSKCDEHTRFIIVGGYEAEHHAVCSTVIECYGDRHIRYISAVEANKILIKLR